MTTETDCVAGHVRLELAERRNGNPNGVSGFRIEAGGSHHSFLGDVSGRNRIGGRHRDPVRQMSANKMR
jgi:hypothetical protein